MRTQENNKNPPHVAAALEKTLTALGISNLAQLAVILRVSTQAVHTWALEQNVPPKRALQIEVITGGAVSWEELMPNFREEIVKDAAILNISENQKIYH